MLVKLNITARPMLPSFFSPAFRTRQHGDDDTPYDAKDCIESKDIKGSFLENFIKSKSTRFFRVVHQFYFGKWKISRTQQNTLQAHFSGSKPGRSIFIFLLLACEIYTYE